MVLDAKLSITSLADRSCAFLFLSDLSFLDLLESAFFVLVDSFPWFPASYRSSRVLCLGFFSKRYESESEGLAEGGYVELGIGCLLLRSK